MAHHCEIVLRAIHLRYSQKIKLFTHQYSTGRKVCAVFIQAMSLIRQCVAKTKISYNY